MATRGIIGRKPTTTGLTLYSDVFGPDTQFAQQATGTWPSGPSVSGNIKFLIGWSSLQAGHWFNTYQKMSNGLYYPNQPIYSGPDAVTTHATYDTTNPISYAMSSGGEYVAIVGSTADGGTSGTQWFNIFLYKKVSDYYSDYQYMGTLTSIVNSQYWPNVVAFNPAGTILAVGWNGSGASTSGTKFTAYSRSGDTFTAIGGITDVSASTGAVVLLMSWNRQGTSVAVVFRSTPYIAVYNVSDTTFTTITAPAGFPSGTVVYGIAWNHDGSSFAVNASGTTLTIYNRSGDTFTALPTISITTGGSSYRQSSMDWNHDGTLLCVTGSSGLQIFSRSGDTFTSVTLPTQYRTNIQCCAFSTDGTELVYGGSGVFEIFEVNGTTITRPATYKIGAITGMTSYGTLDYFQSASPTSSNFGVYPRYIVMLK